MVAHVDSGIAAIVASAISLLAAVIVAVINWRALREPDPDVQALIEELRRRDEADAERERRRRHP